MLVSPCTHIPPPALARRPRGRKTFPLPAPFPLPCSQLDGSHTTVHDEISDWRLFGRNGAVGDLRQQQPPRPRQLHGEPFWIHIRYVDEIDTRIRDPIQDRVRNSLVGLLTEGGSADAQTGNRETSTTQSCLLHRIPLRAIAACLLLRFIEG